MGVAKNSNDIVELFAKLLEMKQSPHMYMFEITHWDFKHTENPNVYIRRLDE